jgi:hypothetical protein
MRRSSKSLPKDINQRAFEIVRLSTEEPTKEEHPSKRSVIAKYLSEIGRMGGLKGGVARAKILSKKRRSEIARNAVKARWRKMSQQTKKS